MQKLSLEKYLQLPKKNLKISLNKYDVNITIFTQKSKFVQLRTDFVSLKTILNGFIRILANYKVRWTLIVLNKGK